MISRSESAAPNRLMDVGMSARGVSRLEFHPVDWGRAEPVAEVTSCIAEPSEEACLGDDVVAADVRVELSAQIEAARREARVEAREEWEEEMAERVAEERARVLRACEDFGRERAAYFSGVEAEVVKLALAIAARVLHREAKLDPLLLAGVVRVALGKVAEDSAVVLRVPADEVQSWRSVVAEGSVTVAGDERMEAGECVLETNVGKVELGVSAQLDEIETGFFDLLQQRPA